MNEFGLIKRYFDRSDDPRIRPQSGVVKGIGDDCAVLSTNNTDTVISTDTLVAGIHFPLHGEANLIAQRALRVNLSDIAAMGGQPTSFLLALTLPEPDEAWLEGFSRGLHQVADEYCCPLVGGDTTRGPLSITITVLGSVAQGEALLRNGAQVGDDIYVTGSLGDGAAGLALISQTAPEQSQCGVEQIKYLEDRFWQPSPRVAEGLILRNYASAAIDISDGLLADIGHITRASDVGAELMLDTIPLSDSLIHAMAEEKALSLALTGGDDYELCFTVPPGRSTRLAEKITEGLLLAHKIGHITADQGLVCRDARGQVIEYADSGYQHF